MESYEDMKFEIQCDRLTAKVGNTPITVKFQDVNIQPNQTYKIIRLMHLIWRKDLYRDLFLNVGVQLSGRHENFALQVYSIDKCLSMYLMSNVNKQTFWIAIGNQIGKVVPDQMSRLQDNKPLSFKDKDGTPYAQGVIKHIINSSWTELVEIARRPLPDGYKVNNNPVSIPTNQPIRGQNHRNRLPVSQPKGEIPGVDLEAIRSDFQTHRSDLATVYRETDNMILSNLCARPVSRKMGKIFSLGYDGYRINYCCYFLPFIP